MLRYTPEAPSPDVAARAADLEVVVETSTQAFGDRYRELGPAMAAEEVEDDVFADILLAIYHDRLVQWQAFDRPSVHRRVGKPSPNGVDYAYLVERARVAKTILHMLFGQGMQLTRLPYAEQAEHMRRIMRVIEQENLGGSLAEFVGERFVALLGDVNHDYQEMVERRAARARGAAVNMRDININLQQAIQDYMISLLAMIRDNDPVNVKMIRAALRPVDALREQLAGRTRSDTASDSDEEDDESAGTVLEELVAEQAAFDAVVASAGGELGAANVDA